jgi:hypothetical protein
MCFLLTQLDAKVIRLESIKTLCSDDHNFKNIFSNCHDEKGWDEFYVNDGFLFRANKLCITAYLICRSHMPED